MARTSKTTEKIIEAAGQPTADGVLSAASETQPVVDNDDVEDGAKQLNAAPLSGVAERIAAADEAGRPATPTDPTQNADEVTPLSYKDLSVAVSALEADLAFLRGVFGWPTKDA